jgi:hypothetical protein
MKQGFECRYCLYYATNQHTGEIDQGRRFFGTRKAISVHAERHPIGDPEDFAVPIHEDGDE